MGICTFAFSTRLSGTLPLLLFQLLLRVCLLWSLACPALGCAGHGQGGSCLYWAGLALAMLALRRPCSWGRAWSWTSPLFPLARREERGSERRSDSRLSVSGAEGAAGLAMLSSPFPWPPCGCSGAALAFQLLHFYGDGS